MLSWLGDYYYDFPKPKPLEKVLRDLLQPENEIDEKYYLSESMVNYFQFNSPKQKKRGNGFSFKPTNGEGVAFAITTRAEGRMGDNFIKCDQVALLEGVKWDKMHDNCKRIYSPDGISPTITTMISGNTEPKIMIEPILLGGVGEKKSNGGTQFYQQDRIYSVDGVGMAHCADMSGGSYNYFVGDDIEFIDYYNARKGKSPFRKLTQKECWRLMDFDDADYEKARIALNATYYNGADRSGSQLYKQAGNSIVVNCLCEIFKPIL
jgi:DNA (cytosine-5)-methyltransferase 1